MRWDDPISRPGPRPADGLTIITTAGRAMSCSTSTCSASSPSRRIHRSPDANPPSNTGDPSPTPSRPEPKPRRPPPGPSAKAAGLSTASPWPSRDSINPGLPSSCFLRRLRLLSWRSRRLLRRPLSSRPRVLHVPPALSSGIALRIVGGARNRLGGRSGSLVLWLLFVRLRHATSRSH